MDPFLRVPYGTIRGGGAGGFDFYVDSVNGDDSNDGLTTATAFETFTAAIAASEAGDSIGLRAGQFHGALSGTLAQQNITSRAVGKYGAGDYATLDARQQIAGLTWTLESGDCWKTTVTFRNATTAGGRTANTTHFALYVDEEYQAWQVGGANIAANVANVVSTPGSWTIHETGSTQQDARDDTGTSFEVYIHLPDSSDPNDATNIKINDLRVMAFAAGDTSFNGIDFIGAWSKDSLGRNNYTDPPNQFTNCRIRDVGSHAWVGPANCSDLVITGKTRPGMVGDTLNRSATYNLFTNSFRSTEDLTIHNLTVTNGSNAVYGHGSGNQGFRTLNISGDVSITNTNAAIQFDVVGAGRLPFVTNGIECSANIQFVGCTDAFKCDGFWYFDGGGYIELGPDPLGTTLVRLVEFLGTACLLRLRNTQIKNVYPISVGRGALLFTRACDLTHTTPILELDNVQDISDNANRLILHRTGGAELASKAHLILKNGTVLKDLHDIAGRTFYPAELTVEAGCTFGLGGRTGPQIESVLTAASVPFSISGDTTIVGLSNEVLSAPGWK